jgi:hypothetical protein
MRHEHAGILVAGGLWWIQLVIIGAVVGVPLLAGGGALLLRARSAGRAARAPEPGAGLRGRYAGQVRRCGLAGLVAGGLAGVWCVAAGRPVLAVLCCAIGYLLGLLFAEATAAVPDRDALRTAGLGVRRAADYAPRWVRYAVLACVVVLVAAPVIFSLAPGIHSYRWHPAPGVALPAVTSWPSMVTSVGSAALAVIVMVAGGLALRRVAARPRAAELQDLDVDDLVRRQAGRAAAGAVLAIELLLLGMMLIAGSDGLAVPADAGAYLASRALICVGLACIASGFTSWVALSGRAGRFRIGARLAAMLRPGAVPAEPRTGR